MTSHNIASTLPIYAQDVLPSSPPFISSDRNRKCHEWWRHSAHTTGSRHYSEQALSSIGISSSNLHNCQHVPELHSVEKALEEHTLGANDQTATLLSALVDGLNDVDQLLLVLQDPVQFVVVTRSEITHHVFIAIEVHDSHRVVELVHGTEVGDLVEIAEVNDSEV